MTATAGRGALWRSEAPGAAPGTPGPLVQYALLAGTAYLARRFGTLPVYRASIAAFTIASALCALAPNASALVAARILQGLVAAPLVPLAMSMLLGRGPVMAVVLTAVAAGPGRSRRWPGSCYSLGRPSARPSGAS